MVSSIYFGGVGGSEKDLLSLVESMNDSVFYIFSENINSEGFTPKSYNYYLKPLFITNKKFDAYYYFAGGGHAMYHGDSYDFKVKIINTNARNISSIENKFDYIIHQCTDFPRFFNNHDKHIFTFPDVRATFPKDRTPIELPEKYFITVFNPFSSKQKGYDIFLKAAELTKYPIVWCFNNKTIVQHDTLPDHPNIIKMPNLAQEELFYAYEHAKAFISFSTYESFGWALAEAFFCNIPIISAKTGFLDYIYNQKGIHIYTNEKELSTLLATNDIQSPEYSYDIFLKNSYKTVIEKLIELRI
ncbi:glycosyltransferase [Methylomonas sp. MK1]|uniref:glycosyltransferase n=1 Tax=Methylomonas sp. MK1 TaxID=1131552 RepID=UPI001360B1B1|nr:glycosyltransferase [Methylomonas sp. MK1]